MGRRKERAPSRIPDNVWKNLDKPAADVGVGLASLAVCARLFVYLMVVGSVEGMLWVKLAGGRNLINRI